MCGVNSTCKKREETLNHKNCCPGRCFCQEQLDAKALRLHEPLAVVKRKTTKHSSRIFSIFLQGRRSGLACAEPVEVGLHSLYALLVLAAPAEEAPEADGHSGDAHADEDAHQDLADAVVGVGARLEPVVVGRGLPDDKAPHL